MSFNIMHHVNRVQGDGGGVSKGGTSDFSIDIFSSEERDPSFDWNHVSVPASNIIESTCIEKVDVMSRNTSQQPFINLVSSFEDAVLCMSIISFFIEAKEPTEADDEDDVPPVFKLFVVLKISGLRLVIVDNVVGLHMPLFQVYLEDFSITLDSSSFVPDIDFDGKYRLFGGVRFFADYFNYS